jgi:ribosomal protein L37AE/L43A
VPGQAMTWKEADAAFVRFHRGEKLLLCPECYRRVMRVAPGAWECRRCRIYFCRPPPVPRAADAPGLRPIVPRADGDS